MKHISILIEFIIGIDYGLLLETSSSLEKEIKYKHLNLDKN
jgi:hypothetical protein